MIFVISETSVSLSWPLSEPLMTAALGCPKQGAYFPDERVSEEGVMKLKIGWQPSTHCD